MKSRLYRKIAMFMAFVMIVPMLWSMNIAVVQAATPSFVQNKVEIVGIGKTYQLEIQNQVAKSTYVWTTSKATVATVTDKGLVTSVGKGSATIQCKITYPSKKTKTITCKVTVTVPAETIVISNATLTNGAQVLSLGQTYDFDAALSPAGTSDKVFWSIEGGDTDCIRMDDAVNGKITANKAGKVILKATAAKSATAEAAATSTIYDTVIIEVTGPTATVKSAEITSSNTITVVFDSAVLPSTVIGANNALSDNITVSLCKNAKNVVADDPGALSASLSADNMTLTINSANGFDGYYGIYLSDKILTASGVAFKSYYKNLYFIDTTPPAYATTTVDDTGYIAKITFTEALNFTNLKVGGAALISTTGSAASDTTLTVLNNALNYIVSADKKSLSINLASISPADYGKMFQVYISGVTDLAGNYPANMYITAYLQTDTSYKAQAQLITLVRSGNKTITATFNRAIQSGGYIQIAGGSMIPGVVDTTDSKKVHYTLTDIEAAYSGSRAVSIGQWNSYNVNPADVTANTYQTRYVDFTADTASPIITGFTFDSTTGILTLTCNEEVTLAAASGVISSTYTSSTDDIKPYTNISYASITHTEGKNIIKLQLTGVATIGTYTFTLDQGFVVDNFNNKSVAKPIVLSNTTGNTTTSQPLAPTLIAQSTTNLSQINVKFQYKLDVASAQTVSNYTIAGLTILSATLSENTSAGANVVLTVPDGSIVAEVARPVTINGVKGYNSNLVVSNYSTTITLKENTKPVVTSYAFDSSTKNAVKFIFSEAITGSMTVKVTYFSNITSTNYMIPSTVAISGNSVIVSLGSVPPSGGYLRIDVLENTIADANGNTATTIPVYYNVGVNY